MAHRALKPTKADKKSLRWINDHLDGEDFMGILMTLVIACGITATFTVPLVSLWFFFLFGLPVIWGLYGIAWFSQSEYLPRHDKTLYHQAFIAYNSIILEDSKTDARTLLDNVWLHEVALIKMGKYHESRHHCKECSHRVQLISQIAESQSLPQTGMDDIEAMEIKLKVRKELGV